MEDKLKSLYDNLTKDNYDLPAYDIFRADMEDPVKSKKLHDTLTKDNYDVPDYDTFVSDLGVKKKGISFQDAITQGKEDIPFLGMSGKKPVASEDSSTQAQPLPSVEQPKPQEQAPYWTLPLKGLYRGIANVVREASFIAGALNPAEQYIRRELKKENIPADQASIIVNNILNTYATGQGQVTGNQLGDAIERIGDTGATPDHWVARALEGAGEVGVDIALTAFAPELKAETLVKYGLTRSLNFPSVMATRNVAQAGMEGQKTGNIIGAGARGFKEGLTYEALGLPANKLGELVKAFGGKELSKPTANLASSATRGLAGSALFGGYGLTEAMLNGATPEQQKEALMSNAFMGGIFHLKDLAVDIPNFVRESIQTKAYVSYLTATDKTIKAVAEADIDPVRARDESIKLWQDAEKETDPEKKQALISKANILDNAVNIKAVSDAIVEDPGKFLASIRNNPNLSEAQRTMWIDKIGNTVRDADPRIKESQPIIDGIKSLQDDLKNINTLYTDPILRSEKESAINAQISSLRKALVTNLNRPLSKSAEFYNIGKEVFGSKQELFDWLDKNGTANIPPANEIGFLSKRTQEAIQEWETPKKPDLKGGTPLSDEQQVISLNRQRDTLIEDVKERLEKGKLTETEANQKIQEINDSYDTKIKPFTKKEEESKNAEGNREENPQVSEEVTPRNEQEKAGVNDVRNNEQTRASEQQKQEEVDIYKGLSNQERNGVMFAEALPKIMEDAFAAQKPFKEAFLKRKGLTEEEFNKLPQDKKDELQKEWGESPELKELLSQTGNKVENPENAEISPSTPEVAQQSTQGEIVPKTPISEGKNEVKTEPPQPPVPPEGENTAEIPTKKREIGRKAVEDSTLPDDIKQELLDKGIDYIPRGRKVTDAEAEQIVKLYEGVEGGVDKLAADVYNLGNGILPDTRTLLNTIVAEKYANQLEGTTDPVERSAIRDKLTDAVIFGAEQGTLGGQMVESQKRWGKLLGSQPELLVASVREKIDRENRAYFADKTTEVEFAKKLMQEFTNTKEFKEAVQKGIGEEIDKIGTKNWGKESKKKIDDFFDSLLIDPKQQNLYGGLLGIPVAMYNGSILAIKNALLLGVDLATAIQKGAEYLDKEFGDEKWNKADYINDTTRRLRELNEKVPGVSKPKVKPRKEKAPPTQEEIVNKLFERMAKFATRKQVANFVQDYLQEISKNGVVTDPRFRAILSKALGRDYVTEQTEAKITNAARAISGANKKMEDFAKTFEDYIKEYESNPKSEKLNELKKAIEKARKASEKATFEAKKANQAIKEVLNEEPDLIGKMGTLIQGNLLVPSSQVANVIGNISLLPATSSAYLIAGGADAIASMALRALEPLKKIDPKKYPWLYREAQKIPSTERTIRPLAYAKGYLEGFPRGLKQGVKELQTGALSGEFGKGEVARGLHPIDAAIRVYKSLSGQEKRAFGKLVGDVLEALPAGYVGEGQFRALNLGDKPFRTAGETARLSEIFENNWDKRVAEAKKIADPEKRKEKLDELDGIKNIERDKFINHPDSESLKQAKQQGAVATYSQGNAISEAILSFERKLSGKDKTPSAVMNNLIRLFKITNLPYVKTPINITGMALEYSIPAYPLAKMAVHTYRGDKRAAMDDFGKAMVGAMITTVAISLARNGLITTLSDDKDVKAAQMAVGKEGGRINYDGIQRMLSGGDPAWQEGDRTYSIKRLGVLSVQLMSIAEAYKDKSFAEIEKQREGSPISAILQTNVEMLPSVVKVAMEQSIMSGINTMIQGLLGGEAEKDRWLVNQATAFSTVAYPNTVAAISQTVDPDSYFRETRDLSKEEGRIKQHLINTFKDRMFMGKSLPAKVSIWGQPIERIPKGETWMYNLLGIAKEKKYQKYSFGTRLYELYEGFEKENPDEANKIFPSQPSPATKVGWDDSKMTPKELSQYQMRVGTLRAQEAENYINSQEWEDATLEDRVTELTKIYSKARRQAEAEMFSWSDYKEREPAKWTTLMDKEALPLPTMISKLKEYKLTPEDVKQLNETALQIYADDIIPYLSQDKKALDEDKASIDEKTGISDYMKELNKSWSSALKEAKGILLDVLEEKPENLNKQK